MGNQILGAETKRRTVDLYLEDEAETADGKDTVTHA
jgi:hypothetical protein